VNDTVLIVDEDINAGIIAETLLRLRGFNVRVATDSADLCAIVRRENPAVVIMDLGAAGSAGFEVLRQLRGQTAAQQRPAEPRIIVVTDRREPEVERFARRSGADAFLRKPLAPGQFIDTVERLAAAPLRHGALPA